MILLEFTLDRIAPDLTLYPAFLNECTVIFERLYCSYKSIRIDAAGKKIEGAVYILEASVNIIEGAVYIFEGAENLGHVGGRNEAFHISEGFTALRTWLWILPCGFF